MEKGIQVDRTGDLEIFEGADVGVLGNCLGITKWMEKGTCGPVGA